MLLQNHTFDELVKLDIISERKKYYVKSKLKKLGIYVNSAPVDKIDITRFDNFGEYYKIIEENFINLLKNNHTSK